MYRSFHGYCYHYYQVVCSKIFGEDKSADPGKAPDPGKTNSSKPDPGKPDPGKPTAPADKQSSTV